MPRLRLVHLKRTRIQRDERGFGMKKMGGTFKRFLKETDGLETAEYGIMTALIIGAIVVTLVLLMVTITDTFANAASLMD